MNKFKKIMIVVCCVCFIFSMSQVLVGKAAENDDNFSDDFESYSIGSALTNEDFIKKYTYGHAKSTEVSVKENPDGDGKALFVDTSSADNAKEFYFSPKNINAKNFTISFKIYNCKTDAGQWMGVNFRKENDESFNYTTDGMLALFRFGTDDRPNDILYQGFRFRNGLGTTVFNKNREIELGFICAEKDDTLNNKWVDFEFTVADDVFTLVANGNMIGQGIYDKNTVSGLLSLSFCGLKCYIDDIKVISEDKYTVSISNTKGVTAISNKKTSGDGSIVEFTAETSSGYQFKGWYVNNEKVSDEFVYKATVSGNILIEAKADPNEYTLTIEKNGNGTISGDGTKKTDEQVTISAVPDEGYLFAGWYNDTELFNEEENYTFAMVAHDLSLKGYFVAEGTQKYNIAVSLSNVKGGTVSGEGNTYADIYKTIQIQLNDGYIFKGWYNGDELLSTELKYSFLMPENDVTIKAIVDINKFKITVINGVNQITSSYYADNQSYLEVFAKPAMNGYVFSGWISSVEGTPEENGKYVIDSVNSDITLTAVYNTLKYDVIVSSNDIELGTLLGAGNYSYKKQIRITPTFKDGAKIKGYKINGVSANINEDGSLSFEMPANDVTVECIFEKTAQSCKSEVGFVNLLFPVLVSGIIVARKKRK